jgi:hypothetical protein
MCAAMRTIFTFLFAFAVAISASAAEPAKTIYVQFIRGTDKDCKNTCREIGPKLAGKLSPVFRWKHYWEIDRKKLTVTGTRPTRMELPGDRRLEIQHNGKNEVEARLYRRTGLVTKEHKSLNSGMLILGGEEESRESFFVVVRKDEPTTE